MRAARREGEAEGTRGQEQAAENTSQGGGQTAGSGTEHHSGLQAPGTRSTVPPDVTYQTQTQEFSC